MVLVIMFLLLISTVWLKWSVSAKPLALAAAIAFPRIRSNF